MANDEMIERKPVRRIAPKPSPQHPASEPAVERARKADSSSWEKLVLGLMIAIVFIYAFNTYQLGQIAKMDLSNTGSSEVSLSTSTNVAAGAGPDVIPKGVPKTYGAELGVSFSEVTPTNPQLADVTIKKMAALDQQLKLEGDALQRYITIGLQISCEYCCGAESIIFKNGEAACGCAHSYAMRGLAKYLLKNHPTEYTDDQILEEMGKWKVLFFPGVHQTKAQVLKDKGIELNYINLASNKYRGIEKGEQQQGGGQMVGGC